ncbi:hypothetical protein BCR44DRAFT_66486, partial [Catenaria anguillulae PL171]
MDPYPRHGASSPQRPGPVPAPHVLSDHLSASAAPVPLPQSPIPVPSAIPPLQPQQPQQQQQQQQQPLPPPTPTPIPQQPHPHWPAPPPDSAVTTLGPPAAAAATVPVANIANVDQRLTLYQISTTQLAAFFQQHLATANDLVALVASKNLELQAKDNQILHFQNQLAHQQQLAQAANSNVDARIQAAVTEALALASANPPSANPAAVVQEVSGCSSCALRQSHIASLLKELGDCKSSNTDLQAKCEKLRSEHKHMKTAAHKYRTRSLASEDKAKSSEAIRFTLVQQSAALEEANKNLAARLDAAEARARDLDDKLKAQETVNAELVDQLHAFAREAGLAVAIGIADKLVVDRAPVVDSANSGRGEQAAPQPQQPPAIAGVQQADPSIPPPTSTTCSNPDPTIDPPRPDLVIVDDSPMPNPAPLQPLTSSALPDFASAPPLPHSDPPAPPASSQTQDAIMHEIRSPAFDQPVQHDATNLAPPARPLSPIDVTSSPIISNLDYDDDVDMDVDPAALATSSDEMDVEAAATAYGSDDVDASRKLRQATLTQMQRDWVASKSAVGDSSPAKSKRRHEHMDAFPPGAAAAAVNDAEVVASAKQLSRETDTSMPESPSSAKKRRTGATLDPAPPVFVPVKIEYTSRGGPISPTTASRRVTIIDPIQRRSASPISRHPPAASTSPAPAPPKPRRGLTFGATSKSTSAAATPKQAPAVKYNPVVRSKEARKSMHGTDCPCCKPFFTAAYPDPEVAAQRIQQVSRHRSMHQVSSTPDGFWDIGFPETQEEERERRERKEREEREIQVRRRARPNQGAGNSMNDAENQKAGEGPAMSEDGESEVGLGAPPPGAVPEHLRRPHPCLRAQCRVDQRRARLLSTAQEPRHRRQSLRSMLRAREHIYF